MKRRLVRGVGWGLRFAWGLRYDAAVLAGAGLIAVGLSMVHPALAPIWLGAGLIYTVARAGGGPGAPGTEG